MNQQFSSFKSYYLVLFVFFSQVVFAQTTTSVIIGSQVWSTQNLNVNKFRNGDSIPEAKTADQWLKFSNNKQPAWCYYNNIAGDGRFGKLYNWYAVTDSRGLAPLGWHVPSKLEIQKLITFLGDSISFGGSLKYIAKLASMSYWQSPNTGATNSTGFTALPGGCRKSDGSFYGYGFYGYWWNTTEFSPSMVLSYNCNCINDGPQYSNQYGFSVRCIKD